MHFLSSIFIGEYRKFYRSNSHCALWTELSYTVLWHFFSLDKFHNKNKILAFNVHGFVHRNNILIYIQQDATLHSLFYLKTALHVSGGTITHHQERKQLYLQHLVFVTPLLLSTAIVEEFELVWGCCGWHTPPTAPSNQFKLFHNSGR